MNDALRPGQVLASSWAPEGPGLRAAGREVGGSNQIKVAFTLS